MIFTPHQRGRGGVAKNRLHIKIPRIHELAVGFAGQQEYVAGLARFNQSLGGRESIDVARATEIHVPGPGVGRDAKPLLDQAGRGGQKVIGRLGTAQDEVDVRGRA